MKLLFFKTGSAAFITRTPTELSLKLLHSNFAPSAPLPLTVTPAPDEF
jgi:hypothetical protein